MRRPALRSLLLSALLVAPPSLAAAQSLPRWTLAPELRITEQADIAWTRISFVAPTPDGSVVIAESFPPMVLRFDASGTLRHRVGRQGGGPGEYQSVGQIGFVNDTLFVADYQQRRVVFFDAAGRGAGMLSGFTGVPIGDGGSAFPGTPLRGDRALSIAMLISRDVATGEVPTRPHLLLSRSGRLLDTIAVTSLGNSQLMLRMGTSVSLTSQPFNDSPFFIAAPAAERGYVVDRSAATAARGATFSVTALRFTGDTIWTRRYPYEPVPLTRSAVDSTIDRMRPTIRGTRVPEATVREALYAPAFRPPISAAFAAADGTLWLRRSDRAQHQYLVHDPGGTAIATLNVPSNTQLHAVVGDQVWGVELDADDVPTVVRYRIRR